MRMTVLTIASVFVGCALLALLATGCAVLPQAKDDCETATRMFGKCGVSLPVVQTQRCTGVAKTIAKCVVQVGGDCDALASLSGRLDECVATANNELPPLEDPPLVGLDGGTDDAGAADLSRAPTDLGSAPADLATKAADLATAWPGLDATGSIATGTTRSFQVAVAPGTYTFSITGTGDADLYVRLGHAPTLNLYDCRPFLNGSDESCPITVATVDIAYVTLRSDTEASTFHLVAKED